jgi:hypothetical protein
MEMKRMTVSELFRKYDFESVLPHFDHLFEVNSKHHLSDESIEVFRGIYNHWAKECEPKPTDCYIRLVSRWEYTSPSIDMNCHVKNKTTFCYSVADQKDMIEVPSLATCPMSCLLVTLPRIISASHAAGLCRR